MSDGKYCCLYEERLGWQVYREEQQQLQQLQHSVHGHIRSESCWVVKAHMPNVPYKTIVKMAREKKYTRAFRNSSPRPDIAKENRATH